VQLKLISSLDNWNGPTDNIWGDDECPFFGKHSNINLDACKNACIEKPGCTAISYSTTQNKCILRECTQPIPSPAWEYGNGYKGYYLPIGTINEYE